MRTITLIIIHCSATPEGKSLSFEACKRDHMENRHFRDIGYHYYITRDGHIHAGRPEQQTGAHCKNHNSHSIGICYEGGLDRQGRPPTRAPRRRRRRCWICSSRSAWIIRRPSSWVITTWIRASPVRASMQRRNIGSRLRREMGLGVACGEKSFKLSTNK